MSDDSRHDPFADVINVLAAPIAGGLRSVEQFQRGIGEFFRAIENLNRTLENLNETATRVNRLVGDIEEPIRAMIPQVTRTIHAADEMTKLLQGPVRVAAPNIEKIVETLSSPGFSTLPNQLGEFMDSIGEVSRRLAPLTQFAENAGGLFGGFKLPGMGGAPRPTPATAPPVAPTPPATTPAAGTPRPDTLQSGDEQSAAKDRGARQSTPQKSPAKKSTARKSTAQNSTAARNRTGQKSTARKSTAQKSTGGRKQGSSAKQSP